MQCNVPKLMSDYESRFGLTYFRVGPYLRIYDKRLSIRFYQHLGKRFAIWDCVGHYVQSNPTHVFLRCKTLGRAYHIENRRGTADQQTSSLVGNFLDFA